MMKKWALILTVMIVASNSFATESVLRKSEKIKLDFGRKSTVTLENDYIKVQCTFLGRLNRSGHFRLTANPTATCNSYDPINFSYHVAFFDAKENLLSAVCQDNNIASDQADVTLESCIMKVPENVIGKIDSYQVVVYTTKPE